MTLNQAAGLSVFTMTKKHNRKKNRNETVAVEPGKQGVFDPFRPVFLVRVLIVIQLFVLAWQFSPDLDTNGDNASYYILGKALISGQGYHNLSHPQKPVETQYPIVFPLILALSQIPASSPLIPKITFAFFGVMVTLLSWMAWRDRIAGLIVPLVYLVASSGFVVEYSVILMAEIPYLALSLLSLVLLDKSIKNPGNRILFWAAAIVSITPMNCRSIGVTFSAAWVIGNLVERRYRHAAAHAVLVLLAAILFRSLTSWDNPYILQLFQKNSYDPELGYVTAAGMIARVGANIAKLAGSVIPNAMIPLASTMAPFLRSLLAKTMLTLVFVGWVQGLLGKFRITSLYLFFYLGVMSLWQTQWTSERFIVAILPVVYLFLLTGLQTVVVAFRPGVAESLRAFVSRVAGISFDALRKGPLLAAVITVCAASTIANGAYLVRRHQTIANQSPDWRNYYSCADWVRFNTPENAVIISRKPTLFYIRSSRRGLAYPFSHDAEKVIEFMKDNKITHVVFDNFAWTRTTARYLQPAISAHPEMFKVVYALKNPDTFVMEFKAK